jgi:hypothetical protein
MLAIRGLSDIVGLKRSEAWKKFACDSAAAFTRAFLRTRPVEVGSSTRTASDASPRSASKPNEVSARPRPHASPRQNTEVPMTRSDMLTRLQGLLPSQFDEVLFRTNVPLAHLPAGSQTTRATGAILYLEQQNRLEQLAQILQQVASHPR